MESSEEYSSDSLNDTDYEGIQGCDSDTQADMEFRGLEASSLEDVPLLMSSISLNESEYHIYILL